MCEMFIDHDGRKLMTIANMTCCILCALYFIIFWGTRDP
jgi:hypothetical protein